ncbi:MAG: HEPN domain-containing protein [Chloroflexi bacterium]|nr:HEPN domain-containing protein [Chloroflexota bacterium]
MRQVEQDLRAARLSANEGFYAQACFFSQQATIKALKGVAYLRGDRYMRKHTIVELLPEVIGSFPELEAIRQKAEGLDQYYCATRYPDAWPDDVPSEKYDEHDAQHALADAEAIMGLARRLIEGR